MTGKTGWDLPVLCFMHVLKFSYRLVLHYYILTTQIWTYKVEFLKNACSLEEKFDTHLPIHPPKNNKDHQ